MGRHDKPSDNGDKGNGDKSNGDKGNPYRGSHRSEGGPGSGPLGNRLDRPHAEDGWFPERD